MKKIDLIQPRHNYASKEGLGHVYMPTSLLTAGARLIDAGVDVVFHDENFQPASVSSDVIGINLLGAPYIPEAIALMKRIDGQTGRQNTYVLGGQVVSGLTAEQFKRLFGERAINGNIDSKLTGLLGIPALAQAEKTSMVLAYDRIPENMQREYLAREGALHVSQGCHFKCDFCAAAKNRTESYKGFDVLKKDLRNFARKANEFGLKELSFYMSNLDVFQTPEMLNSFSGVVQEVQREYPFLPIRLRGLSTVSEFLRTRDKHRRTIESVVDAGFHTVGFGVDGWSPEVWKKICKRHNTQDKCIDSIRSAREDFGLTPEILMVFGHEGVDNEESLRAAYEIVLSMKDKYGAVPRPHASKSFIPGNQGWRDAKNQEAIELLLMNPEAFQALDFTALPSWLTHSDERLRELATKYFVKMCEITGNTTQYVKQITPDLTPKQREGIKRFNEGRFDR